jgi:hypothetical protein
VYDEQLVAVGTGIRTIGQVTLEALAWIRRADKVVHVVSDPVAEDLIQTLNPDGAESFHHFYAENKPRLQIYHEMVERILAHVRSGKRVCMVAYGHPGVFVYPTHVAIQRARAEGYKTRVLPGISAEDCLFADLNLDPALAGCQSYEATDFLINGRIFDPSTPLILWQIGVLGQATFSNQPQASRAMPQLLERLAPHYRPDHPAIVYEAPIFPGAEPLIMPVPLAMLPQAPLKAISTLVIPPSSPPRTNMALAQALGLR